MEQRQIPVPRSLVGLVQRLQHFHTAATRLDYFHLDSFIFILFHSIDSKSPLGRPWWILLVQRTQTNMFGHVSLQQGSCDSTNFPAIGLVYFTSEYAVENMGIADIMHNFCFAILFWWKWTTFGSCQRWSLLTCLQRRCIYIYIISNIYVKMIMIPHQIHEPLCISPQHMGPMPTYRRLELNGKHVPCCVVGRLRVPHLQTGSGSFGIPAKLRETASDQGGRLSGPYAHGAGQPEVWKLQTYDGGA